MPNFNLKNIFHAGTVQSQRHLTEIIGGYARSSDAFWEYPLYSLLVEYGSLGKGREEKDAKRPTYLSLNAEACFLLQIRMCLCKPVIMC